MAIDKLPSCCGIYRVKIDVQSKQMGEFETEGETNFIVIRCNNYFRIELFLILIISRIKLGNEELLRNRTTL